MARVALPAPLAVQALIECDGSVKKAAGLVASPFGTLIRIADDVATDASIVASIRGFSMAEMLAETLRPIRKKALTDELREADEEGQ